ncbi:hypothetical protein N9Y89_02390 [bacterium]|nr:hypothetical protein [bacterium]
MATKWMLYLEKYEHSYPHYSGDEISWRIRGACGTNGTSWATIFSELSDLNKS